MQDTSFSSGVSTGNANITAQAGAANANPANSQAVTQQQQTSIFSKNSNNNNVNQSFSNSGGTGGLGTIFGAGAGLMPATFDNTSIFSGINRGSHYALYSNKDYSYDVPKLTQEDIANQKAAVGEKRTNPKPYNIDMTPKENPYASFRNPELQEMSFTESIANAFSNIFGQKKAD